MARSREYSVVAVIGNLTNTEAAQVTKEIMKAKGKYTSEGRGTIVSGKSDRVGGLLQKGHKSRALKG